jgi:exopolysaccharide biosynthesis polyprenyl glycosylphosphotransferase
VVAGAETATLVSERYGRRDWLLRRLLAIGDAACLAATMAFTTASAGGQRGHSWGEYLLYGLATVPAWVVLLKVYGLYERDAKRLAHSTLDEIPALFHALLVGCLLIWCWFALAGPARMPYVEILAFGVLAMALLCAGRACSRAGFSRLVPAERVLLIGSGRTSGALIEKLRATAGRRLLPVGMVSCRQHAELARDADPACDAHPELSLARDADPALSLERLGSLEEVDLPALLVEHRIGRVMVADVEVERERLLGVLRDCKNVAVKVSLLPATSSALGPLVEVDDLQGLTVLGINPPVLSRSSRLVKRALDLIGAGLLSLLAAPVIAVLALAIKLDSDGPVLFSQERIGQGGRRFRLVKLRTMVTDAEARRAELLAHSKDPGWLHLEHDPRITRLGRLLRLTSLDELPQLWNVLRGDMSLVGPRPLVAEEDRLVDGWARGRLGLTPGITGLWQVLGRTSIPFEEMVRLDYLYVTNWSLWGDVRLILRTLPVVLRRSGAN